MVPLLYALIRKRKTRRWFMILDALEKTQSRTAQELADRTNCTKRTIQTDIRQIKQYFGDSIIIVGDDDGCHFSFLDPQRFYAQKQALLDEEMLFFFFTQLFDGVKKNNQEWAEALALSPSGFGRLKREAVTIAETRYRVSICSDENRLTGEEAAIRQFMYDLYFTLPLLPSYVSGSQRNKTNERVIGSAPWLLDPILLDQWTMITRRRTTQGCFLPDKVKDRELEQWLGSMIAGKCHELFPERESISLFLLSLREEQFIDSLKQQAFIQQFSPFFQEIQPAQEAAQLATQFFDTMIYLMNGFFQLPPQVVEQEEQKQIREARLSKQLMSRYIQVKQQQERTVALTFDLAGCSALTHWIKQTVEKQWDTLGYCIVNGDRPFFSGQAFQVTNKLSDLQRENQLCLTKIPSEKEIAAAIQAILAL